MIWPSLVALFWAVGSVPSLMASRNDGGVRTLSPSAWAIGAKMLSDAPTGTPGYLDLIWAISWLYWARPAFTKDWFWVSK